MIPRLTVVGSNQNRVEVGNHTLYFSYNTLVAYDGPHGKARINACSRTTAKHINAFGVADCPIMDDATFESFVNNAISEDAEE